MYNDSPAPNCDHANHRGDVAVSEKRIDWKIIEQEFAIIRFAVDDVRLPTRQEIDAYKASQLRPNLFKSPLQEQFRAGYALPPSEWQLPLVELASKVLSSTHEPTLPEYLAAFDQHHLKVVEQAIRRREVSLEFIYSWGILKQALGVYNTLIAASEVAEKSWEGRHKRALKTDKTLKRYWVAHWLARAGVLEGRVERADALAGLALLCEEIAKRKRKPVRFEKEWFETLIDENGSPKSTYSRISAEDMRELNENPFIPADKLPPLHLDEFPALRP